MTGTFEEWGRDLPSRTRGLSSSEERTGEIRGSRTPWVYNCCPQFFVTVDFGEGLR